MIEQYLSIQDTLGIGIVIGVALKIFQFLKEGKFKK